MTGFRPAGRKRHPERTPPGTAGVDPARFAAADLPPYRPREPAATAQADPEITPEIAAARAAAAHFDALYDSEPPRRRFSPMLIMGAVFAIGAGVGLGGAHWFSQAPQTPSFQAPVAALSTPPVAAIDPEGPAKSLRGIRPSELPYDGRASDEGIDDVPAVPDLPKADSPSADDTLPASPRAGIPKADTPKADAPDPPAATPKPPREPEAEKAEAPPPKPAKRAETPARKQTQSASSRGAKDKEIERLRREADDELRKKSASSGSSGGQRDSGERDTPPARPTRLQQVTAALARCDRNSNIILREHCRWQICNGSWGRNGCPSYTTASRDPY